MIRFIVDVQVINVSDERKLRLEIRSKIGALVTFWWGGYRSSSSNN